MFRDLLAPWQKRIIFLALMLPILATFDMPKPLIPLDDELKQVTIHHVTIPGGATYNYWLEDQNLQEKLIAILEDYAISPILLSPLEKSVLLLGDHYSISLSYYNETNSQFYTISVLLYIHNTKHNYVRSFTGSKLSSYRILEQNKAPLAERIDDFMTVNQEFLIPRVPDRVAIPSSNFIERSSL